MKTKLLCLMLIFFVIGCRPVVPVPPTPPLIEVPEDLPQLTPTPTLVLTLGPEQHVSGSMYEATSEPMETLVVVWQERDLSELPEGCTLEGAPSGFMRCTRSIQLPRSVFAHYSEIVINVHDPNSATLRAVYFDHGADKATFGCTPTLKSLTAVHPLPQDPAPANPPPWGVICD